MNSIMNEMNENSSADENENTALTLCCLIEENQKCRRPAGLASFSKRIQTKIQRKLKLSLDSSAVTSQICDFHKSRIQTARNSKRQRVRHDESDSESDSNIDVDFDRLQVQTLRRYKKFYKVSTRPGMNKAQLAEIISKHFKGLPIPDEKLVLTYFIYSVKNLSPNND